MFMCFFFQAEDGIRDDLVTGVQTCALPISCLRAASRFAKVPRFRRLQLFGSLLREYSRYWPDFSFRIIASSRISFANATPATRGAAGTPSTRTHRAAGLATPEGRSASHTESTSASFSLFLIHSPPRHDPRSRQPRLLPPR